MTGHHLIKDSLPIVKFYWKSVFVWQNCCESFSVCCETFPDCCETFPVCCETFLVCCETIPKTSFAVKWRTANKNNYWKFIRLVQMIYCLKETFLPKLIVNCVFCKHLVEYGLILGDRMMMIVASGGEHHHLILSVGPTFFLFMGFRSQILNKQT